MGRFHHVAPSPSGTTGMVVLGQAAHGDRLIFVGGPPRSGTTLVQNILDMHPDILAVPEFLHFPDILRLRRAMTVNVERGWLDEYCSRTELEDHLRSFVGALFAKLAGRTPRYISEKTPQNVLCFAELAELFPGARFVNVVRDPRAIVASLLQVYQRALEKGVTVYPDYTRDLHKAIAYTKRCLKKGWEFASSAPDAAYTLKYEDLILDPERETGRLCDFLGLPWSEDLLRPASKVHLGESAITRHSGEIWYDKAGYYRDPDRTNLDKWRVTLAPTDVLIVSRAFRRFAPLEALGYDLDDRPFPMHHRVAAQARAGWRQLTRVMRRPVDGL